MKKQIALVTLGTIGDLAPMADLASELARRGHSVKLGSNWPALGNVEPSVETRCFSPKLDEVLSTRLGHFLVSGNRFITRPIAGGFLLRRHYLEVVEQVATFCDGADLIIQSGLAAGARQVAERNRSPVLRMYLRPAWRSRSQATLLAFGMNRNSPPVAGGSHLVLELGAQVFLRSREQKTRQRLGIPRQRRHEPLVDWSRSGRWPSIFAVPPELANETMRGNWRANCTGFIRGDHFLSAWVPSASLIDWIESQRRYRPIALVAINDYGEGSYATRHSAVIRELGHLGYAVVLLGPYRAGDVAGENTLVVSHAVDHSALLPLSDLYVHNGGTGSTVAALRSGVQSLVVPVWFDQEYWADLLVSLNRARKVRAYGRCAFRQGAIESALESLGDPMEVPFDTGDGLRAACDAVDSITSSDLPRVL
jgi:sterol 3beta-glucosyltransferase